jgi:hypothetical protein
VRRVIASGAGTVRVSQRNRAIFAKRACKGRARVSGGERICRLAPRATGEARLRRYRHRGARRRWIFAAQAQERIDDGSARRAIILRQPCRARCDGRTVPDPVEWAAKAIAARMPPMPDRAASALQRRARKARIAAVDQPPRLR